MLGSAKPLAALSSSLLARKGGARPAMRPQGYASLAPSAAQLEDLGWNDMGAEQVAAPPPVVPPAEPLPVPAVLVEREALREEIETPCVPDMDAPRAIKSVSVATAARIGRETAHVGRAAFTLRLDAERHLKLRLASAVSHRSAQQLVSHALDQFLLTLPEVAALIAHLPPPKLKAPKLKTNPARKGKR